jgi:hypothetical protein
VQNLATENPRVGGSIPPLATMNQFKNPDAAGLTSHIRADPIIRYAVPLGPDGQQMNRSGLSAAPRRRRPSALSRCLFRAHHWQSGLQPILLAFDIHSNVCVAERNESVRRDI